MIKPYNAIDEEQDPYKGWSDSNHITADQPPEQPAEQPQQKPEGPRPYAAAPAIKMPDPQTRPVKAGEPEPHRTFAQMEAEGHARPPMPESAETVSGLLGTPPEAHGPAQGEQDVGQFERTSHPPMAMDDPGMVDGGQFEQPTPPSMPGIADGGQWENPIAQYGKRTPPPSESEEPTVSSPFSEFPESQTGDPEAPTVSVPFDMEMPGGPQPYSPEPSWYPDAGDQAPTISTPFDGETANSAGTEEKLASNGTRYTGPDFYQPDPSKPDYQPNAALPWAPEPSTAAPTPAAPPSAPPTPAPANTEEKLASNGVRYTGPDYYQPDPSKPDYQPNAALPWAPDPATQPTPPPATPPTAPPALEEKLANNGTRYTGPDYYQPDPSKPDYQPNAALPWPPDPASTPPSTPTPPTPVTPLPVPSPASSNPILDLLTGGATGANKSDLTKAAEAKAKAQLDSSSPYDSQAVRDEYNWLSGNIDDQYAMDSRGVDESMAARGLYGSAGKDFHSGRLSDLNVGKRTAKASLAQDLANKFATTKGQYDSNAIDQAGNIGAQGDAQQRAWLQSLMGYGNDAFDHDLAGAEFGQRQNESEQDFLMQMLRMGYGV